jgi:hypothetical protein
MPRLRFASAAVVALTLPAVAADAPTVDCSRSSEDCPLITIAGDSASAVKSFTGFADPGMVADPADAAKRRLYMAYSRLDGRVATTASGGKAGVPVTATHLARSDDGGSTWRYMATLWDSKLTADPEGKGPSSYFGSETPTLAAHRKGLFTTWYSVRLSYFLEPVTAYQPRYATSWVMRIAAAQGLTPAALARAEEVQLGTNTTAAAYGPTVNVNALAPELGRCGMWNNPAIAFEAGRLHVITECLEFDGKTVSSERSRIVVLSTVPAGKPASWAWRYDGVIADRALAQELGGERLVSPAVMRGRDGALLLMVTPQVGRKPFGEGCTALELESLSPPRVRRDPAGKAIVRARQTADADETWHTGACTYDPNSASGIVTVAATTSRGLQAELRATGLRP